MKTALLLILALACFPVATVAVAADVQENPSSQQLSSSINVTGLRQMMGQRKDFVLLDVRSPAEYAEGHIDNAKLIPLPELPARISELPKDKTIVVYCRSGRRSAQAIGLLQSEGFTKVINLEGGIVEWNRH